VTVRHESYTRYMAYLYRHVYNTKRMRPGYQTTKPKYILSTLASIYPRTNVAGHEWKTGLSGTNEYLLGSGNEGLLPPPPSLIFLSLSSSPLSSGPRLGTGFRLVLVLLPKPFPSFCCVTGGREVAPNELDLE
jgi:hypothetical protein